LKDKKCFKSAHFHHFFLQQSSNSEIFQIKSLKFIMASSLDQLKQFSVVVADTGDFHGKNFHFKLQSKQL
jgi:hypothetical protein